MGGIITAITAYFLNLPIWAILLSSLSVFILVVIIISLLVKERTRRTLGYKELKRLPRLVYEIHKRINRVRERLIRKTDWDKVKSDKVLSPLLNVFGGLEINDDKVQQLHNKLSEAGSPPSGIASVSDAIMKKSDTSLEMALRKNFWYRYLCARLENYIPYPNEDIGNTVSRIINASLSINNVIILQAYTSGDTLSLEKLSSLTDLSDVEKMKIYSMNVQAEEKMNDAIEKSCTKLRVLIDDYLNMRSKGK